MRTTIRAALTLAVALIVGSASSAVHAEAQLKGKTYYFGTHPARTNITFVSDADIETIHGVSHEMDGSIVVDTEGVSASGWLRVPVKSMQTGIDLRDEHLRSDAWLDAAKHPWIRLQVVRASESADGRTWDMEANIVIKGVTRKVQAKARVRGIPDALGKALGDGSWVRVRTSFDVTLSQFGVTIPKMIGSKVSDTWRVGVDIYGTTAQPKKEAR